MNVHPCNLIMEGVPADSYCFFAGLLTMRPWEEVTWGSIQLFMWQPDSVRVVHVVMDCLDLLGAAPDARDDGYSDSDSSSSALAAG